MEVVAGIAGKEVVKTVVKTSLDSLVKLIKYEWALEDTVRKGLTSLKSELIFMQACIENVSRGPQDQINSVDKLWLTQVKELSCTIEIGLRSFLSSIEPTKGALLSATNKHYINHAIDSFIQEKLTKAKEVSKLRRRYAISSSQTTSAQEMGARISALFMKESDLVGLDGPTNKIIQMLSNHDHVSIVGMGGIGKTTLARAVYGKLAMKEKFDCCAFVPVGQNANVNKVLTGILDDLSIQISGHAPETWKLIDKLRTSLKGKRCLFVIDDIWHDDIWDMIKHAFVGSPESRYITTTRKAEVAKPEVARPDDVVYMMKSLSDADSEKLLKTRLFCSEDEINVPDFSRLSDKILTKCGGVPLAIVAIARLLAKKPRNEWSKVYDSIGFSEQGGDVEKDIWRILSFSYSDLPYYLQKCFLYLSLFPEGHWIEKNMLIWRWVAEGLVSTVHNEEKLGLFQLGENYFNELIDKSMIQRAVSPRDLGQGGCRVHKMMFDLIRLLSNSENENFSTVIGTKRESTSQASTIHRLAIHKTRVDESENTSTLPQKSSNHSLEVGEVLSFYASTCSGSSLPPISKFRGLRVIDLEGCDLSDGDRKLEHLAKLPELAYLGLLGTTVAELPKEIGLLKFLQTLDVTGTSIKELPTSVEELRMLRCLRAGKGMAMKGRVGKLTSLEELWLHSANKSPDFATELRKLSQLRVLVVHFDKMDQATGNVLVESLSDLTKLQILQIWSDDAEEKVYFSSWGDCMQSKELHQLLLFGVILPKTTRWIHSCDKKLSKLLLQVETLEAVHLEIIGLMPLLLSLYLHSEDNQLSYTTGKDEFKVLEYLYTNIELICGDGALPRIQELEVAGIKAGTDVGMRGNMPLLERASYLLDCKGCDLVKVQKAEEELRQASEAHPNSPALSIKRFNDIHLEMRHQYFGSLLPGILATLMATPGSGGILGLLEGREGKGDAMSLFTSYIRSTDFLDQYMERISTIGVPPTLAVVDTGIGSPSQFAGGLLPRNVHGDSEGKILFPGVSMSPCVEVSANSMLCDNGNQFKAKTEYMANQLGIDPVALTNAMDKFMENPEVVARMDSVACNADGSIGASQACEVLKECLPILVSEIEQNFESAMCAGGIPPMFQPITVAISRAFPDTQGWKENISEVNTDNLLVDPDRLIGTENLAIPPTVATRAEDVKRLVEKHFLDTKLLIKSMPSNPCEPQYHPEMAKMTGVLHQLEGLLVGEDVPSSMSTEKSGARVSYEPLIKIDNESSISWLNTPNADAMMSEFAPHLGMTDVALKKLTDQCFQNPEMIAGMNSMLQKGNISDFVPLMMKLTLPKYIDSLVELHVDGPSSMPCYAGGGQADASRMPSALLSNPAFANQMADQTVQPGLMDAVASTASVGHGVGAAPESSQDAGENFSRMLKQLLPDVQRIQAAGASRGEPSSEKPENVGLEEGTPSKRH